MHLTSRRADEVKWDKNAFVAACSDIAVFKLEKELITYKRFNDARTVLEAIMTGDKEMRKEYIKQKKQIQFCKPILVEKANNVPKQPKRRRRTGLTYRKK